MEEPRYWNFFSGVYHVRWFYLNQSRSLLAGKPQLTTESFPVDLDTTALGFTVIPRDGAIVSSVMDEMLDYRNEDGIVEVSDHLYRSDGLSQRITDVFRPQPSTH